MPLPNTFGAASSRGTGLFGVIAASCCLNDGNKAIFQLGSGGTARNKYTYSSCTSTASGVGAASLGSYFGSAAGNNTRGIFAIGSQGVCLSCGTTTRNKYTYSSCTSTASGVAAASVASGGGSAAGNNTRGIFAIGWNVSLAATSTTRNKYTYACCTSTASGVGVASTASVYQSAAGNSTRGIFALGATSRCYPYSLVTTRNKYTYSSCTSTASGVAAASVASGGGSATGNSTRGIFALGIISPCIIGSTTRNKYTYACCTSTASGVGVASAASYLGSAAGNSTRGIFALGVVSCTCSSTRNKYTYSSCTSTASGVGAASSNSARGAAASWATCVNT